MHRHITRRPLVAASVALAIATTVLVDADAQELGSVYVHVMDQSGQPVTDLTPETSASRKMSRRVRSWRRSPAPCQ